MNSLITNTKHNSFDIFLKQVKDKINEVGDKVSQVAQAVFKAVAHVVTFPLRFIGSKTFSIPGLFFRLPEVMLNHCLGKTTRSFSEDLFSDGSYRRFVHHKLSGDEAKHYLLYASAAAAVQKNKHQWLAPFGFQPVEPDDFEMGFEKDGTILFDRATGLKLSIYEKGDEVLIAFGALGSHRTQFSPDQRDQADQLEGKMVLNAFGSALGGMSPDLFEKAEKFVSKFRQSEKLQNKKLTLCGQCLGGSIASYVGLRQQIPTVAMNTLPLGAGLQQKIGDEKLQKADKILTHVIAEGDCFSNVHISLRIFDVVLSLLGIRTPGNFGKKVLVPSLYQKPLDTHYHILGSLLAKYKPEHTSLCANLASSDSALAKKSMKTVAETLDAAVKNENLSSVPLDIAQPKITFVSTVLKVFKAVKKILFIPFMALIGVRRWKL